MPSFRVSEKRVFVRFCGSQKELQRLVNESVLHPQRIGGTVCFPLSDITALTDRLASLDDVVAEIRIALSEKAESDFRNG